MKISAAAFFLICSALQLWASSGSAQSIRTTMINVELKKATLKLALDQITQQSGFQIAYPSEYVGKYNGIDLEKGTMSVYDVLQAVLSNTLLGFEQQGNSIVLFPKPSSGDEVASQEKIVRGRVTDDGGKPVPGVTVQVKGTRASTITGGDGRYSIVVPNDASVLVFTNVAYHAQERAVGTQGNIDIQLKDATNVLDEVLVVGYGTVRKEDLTGSVGQVNMTDLVKAPVASFDQALAGRVAGVKVTAAEDGQPGSGMNIIIRGANSISQNNSPLYVIDGFPIENPQNAGINPEDIESINVLKDASATAIYGARGANGVIVIETKKGKTGSPVVSYSSSLGYNQVYKTMDMLDPYEFVRYEVERYTNPDDQLGYLAEGRSLDTYRSVKPIDWQDQLLQTGATQIHNISLRGGTNQTKYSISGSVFDSEAIVVNTGYKRYQGRVSLTQTINDKFEAGINLNYSNQKTYGQIVGRTAATSATTISGYLLYSVWAYRPITNSMFTTGSGDVLNELLDDEIDAASDFRINPIIAAKNALRERFLNNLTGNAYLTYKINKNLTLKVTGGLNGLLSRNDAFYNSLTVRGTPLRVNNIQGVNGSVDYGERIDWVNENTLTWNKKIDKRNQLDVVAGFTMQGGTNSAYGYTAILIPNEELGINGLSEGTPLETISARTGNTLSSFLTRVNFNHRSRYLLTATFRADGSSKFAAGNKWAYFPSGAFAWRMDREDFLRNSKFISTSKLRISYGHTGNNRVSDFAYLPSIRFPDLGSYSFNNQRFYGLNMENLGNKDLKWETTSQLDIGYDLGLFKDRINLIADIYRKTTFDLLLNASLPYTTGYSRSFKNIGKIRNEGLELTLNTVNIRNKNFTWESNFNISFNNNKILALADNETNIMSNITSFVSRMAEEPLYIAEIGKPAAMFYGLIWDGVYQFSDFDEASPGVYRLKNIVPTNGDLREAIKPGDIKYRDINNDGVVDANDKTIIGRALPIHTGGFTNNFAYKRFDLSVLLQWSYGNKIMNANRLIFEGNVTGAPHINQFASWADRWTPENPSNTLFRADGAGPQVMSSRTLEDGSFMRLKTVSVGYNFPKNLLKSIGIRSASLNVSAQNLLTWTKYSGMDPEVSIHNSVLTPGFDFSAYPHARTVVFGLKAGL